MRLLIGVFAGLSLIAATIFAGSNPHPVELSFWPLPWEIMAPAFLVALAPFALGAVVGGLMIWSQSLKAAAAARRSQREADRLRAELEALKIDRAADERVAAEAVVSAEDRLRIPLPASAVGGAIAPVGPRS